MTCAQDCSLIATPPCLVAACDGETGQCAVVPGADGSPCDDGQFCTAEDACTDGVCHGSAQNQCGLVVEACTSVTCDETTRSCSLVADADGAPCAVENDLCIVNEACQNGKCVGPPKDCFFAPMPDECHVGECNPATGICDPVPGNDGMACPDDGDLCLVGKKCAAGACQGGTPKDCSTFDDGCNEGVCDPADGACHAVAIPPGGSCAEGTDECNQGVCDASGACEGVPTPGVACASATDACNQGTCDASGACVAAPANEGGACDDGAACTSGEACAAGACTGGQVGNYHVYFSDSFSSNAAGWTMGTEWQIGPAEPSDGTPYGHEDPAADHSTSADNGIAGVVIGGYAQKVVHPPYYLTSPTFDASGAGPLILEFYRWLNSDYLPFMKNSIDVFDGANWVNVWITGGSPAVQDSAWTYESYDVTAYRSASMRVRFGLEVAANGSFTVSSWNVDDVVIASEACGP